MTGGQQYAPPQAGSSPSAAGVDPQPQTGPITAVPAASGGEPPPRRRATRPLLERTVFEVKRVIVGQDRLVERMLVGLLAKGHLLIEGVPGVAKTLAVETFARVVGGTLLPHPVHPRPGARPTCSAPGSTAPGREEFDIELGPVVANFVLADEINRAPAKVQSALLEVMAERHVSIGGKTFPMPDPFLVLATQNPIENEGVYPLPEAQRDRFLFKLMVGYPEPDEEREIVYRMGVVPPVPQQVLPIAELARLQQVAAHVFVHHALVDYVVRLVYATRTPAEHGLTDVAGWLSYGASPRAILGIVAAARALALVRGRDFVRAAGRRRRRTRRAAPPSGAVLRRARRRRPGRRRSSAGCCRPIPLPQVQPVHARPGGAPDAADGVPRTAAIGAAIGGGSAPVADRPPAPRARRATRPTPIRRLDAALTTLELTVRRRLDGLLQGNHLGLVPGPGTEPGDARPYYPGDDVRRMDWSVTARTTEPHIRQTVADRELETWLVGDLSASLDFGTAELREARPGGRRRGRGRPPDPRRRQPDRRGRGHRRRH